ncbi:MAG TPA: serine/threonine-protein kinase [Candidatus Sulfopaludibacter sp.]|jgi:serine/threonine protein kinase|nr:serine/threonine-protein kinase [Candidatus Sulfopaludibacter sp.]
MMPGEWQETERIFLAAAEQAPGARAAFLDAACRPELRGQVEALLAHDGKGEVMVESIVAGAALALQPETEAIRAGDRLGPYSIVREIGQGGMGTVYEAVRKDDQFDQRVAIKVVSQGLETGFVLDRFRRERQVLADLQHPNIARLLDGGATPSGFPYFAMEYLEGVSLIDYGRGLPLRQKLELFLQVCSAVQYAHQKLVIHRDLKPANVLVTAEGVPKLLDFGIAKLLGENPAGPLPAFSGAMTPYYASPEQLAGHAVTTASDVYSLGALLYELVSEHRPFESSGERLVTPQAADERRTPPRPGAMVRGLPRDVDEIVVRALAFEPRDRYSSVEKLSEDLQRFLAVRPIASRERELGERLSKFVRRNRMAVLVSAILLGAALASAIAELYNARLAQHRFDELRHLANSSLFDFHDSIKDLPGATKARAMMVNKALEYLQALSRESGGDSGLLEEVATSYVRVGDVQGNPLDANLGDPAGALQSYRKAIAIFDGLGARSRLSPSGRKARAAAYLNFATLQRTRSDVAGSLRSYRTAQSFFETYTAEHPADNDALLQLAFLYDDMSRAFNSAHDAQNSLEATRKSMVIHQRLAETSPHNLTYREGLAESYASLGVALARTGKLAEALDLYNKNVELSERLAAENPGVHATRRLMLAYSHLGDALGNPDQLNLGKPAEALDADRHMIALAESLVAADQSDRQARFDLAMSHLRTGSAAGAAGETAEALAHYRKALEMTQAQLASDPKNARFMTNSVYLKSRIARQLAASGDMNGAATWYREAIGQGQQLIKLDPSRTDSRALLLKTFREFIVVASRLGDRETATAMQEAILKMLASFSVQNGDFMAMEKPLCYYALGQMHEMFQERSLAVEWFEKSVDGWRELTQRQAITPNYSASVAASSEALQRVKTPESRRPGPRPRR